MPSPDDAHWITLVTALHRIGWPDERISAYTHEPTETVTATRERLGLPAVSISPH